MAHPIRKVLRMKNEKKMHDNFMHENEFSCMKFLFHDFFSCMKLFVRGLHEFSAYPELHVDGVHRSARTGEPGHQYGEQLRPGQKVNVRSNHQHCRKLKERDIKNMTRIDVEVVDLVLDICGDRYKSYRSGHIRGR